jgi:hypothetical protein
MKINNAERTNKATEYDKIVVCPITAAVIELCNVVEKFDRITVPETTKVEIAKAINNPINILLHCKDSF